MKNFLCVRTTVKRRHIKRVVEILMNSKIPQTYYHLSAVVSATSTK
jgi:hypothetical protein